MPERSSYLQGTPSWVDLSTTDPEQAKAFYGAIFGWEFEDNPTPQGVPYTMASKNGKSAAGIMAQNPMQAQQGLPSLWTTYITVDDIEATLGKAEALGGSVIMPTMQVMESGSMAVIGDPSGAAVALWQAADHIGCEIVNEPGALIWNELVTDKLDDAISFYCELLGAGHETQEMPTGAYHLFTVDGQPVGGAMEPPMPQIPNHWSVYFAVEDIEATKKLIDENGGTSKGEIMDIGIGKILPVFDPTGAMFLVMEPAQQAEG